MLWRAPLVRNRCDCIWRCLRSNSLTRSLGARKYLNWIILKVNVDMLHAFVYSVMPKTAVETWTKVTWFISPGKTNHKILPYHRRRDILRACSPHAMKDVFKLQLPMGRDPCVQLSSYGDVSKLHTVRKIAVSSFWFACNFVLSITARHYTFVNTNRKQFLVYSLRSVFTFPTTLMNVEWRIISIVKVQTWYVPPLIIPPPYTFTIVTDDVMQYKVMLRPNRLLAFKVWFQHQ